MVAVEPSSTEQEGGADQRRGGRREKERDMEKPRKNWDDGF